ncbi:MULTISPECIES: hypothetical protein [unclassified Actinotalea]|uniref:hypothetical protein n=1 Tax=unclassified Actinotalea TaxID=2638618 RepID=UPI0015F362FC|nr:MULTISPECIES: hypothetical protein [unclassified Actinotalea]
MTTTTGAPAPEGDPGQAAAPPARLSVRDRLRREWYLARLSWHLQDYPRRQGKQVQRDLRAELTHAAADVGMARAVRDLGHPLVLAESYTSELGRPLPRWNSGAVAATLAVGMMVYLGGAYAIGTLDTLEALGGGTVTRYPFGAPTVFVATQDEFSVTQTPSAPGAAVLVAVGAVAFLLGSRVWRAWG